MSRMTRESMLLETDSAMRLGTLALMTPVRISVDGLCVAMTMWMPAARAFCASRQMESSTEFWAVMMRSASSSMMMTICGITL